MSTLGSSDRTGSGEREAREKINIQQINQRNTVSVEQALIDLTKRLYEVLEVVSSQQKAIGTLQIRLQELDQKLHLQKAEMIGLGPSVKP
jgi:hypothetical protein